MQMIVNDKRANHRRRLCELIVGCDAMILCSGWMKYAGLKKLLPAIDVALARGVKASVYSNRQHTEQACIEALAKLDGLNHILVDHKLRYLHTKLYYFTRGKTYHALVGSANITEGGLVSNDELSLELSGEVGDTSHQQLCAYLAGLSCYAE